MENLLFLGVPILRHFKVLSRVAESRVKIPLFGVLEWHKNRSYTEIVKFSVSFML